LKTLVFIVSCWLGSWIAVEAQSIPIDSLQKRIAKAKLVSDSTVFKSARDSMLKVLPKQPQKKLNPKKAVLYSAILPGLGQAYNKQYWKMPIVYVGMAIPIYSVINFHVRYSDFLVPYKSFYTKITYISGEVVEVTTPNREKSDVFVRDNSDFLGSAILKRSGTIRSLTLEQITRAKDTYRRYRDLNVLLTVAFWALNIVEANVSAHLKTFDVSEDISLRWQPDVNYGAFTGGVIGAKVVIGLK